MGRRVVASVAASAISLVLVAAASAVAPSAVTGATTSVGARSAVVGGRVDPGGEATSWYVEYGPTASYGARTSARSAGNGTAAVDVTEQLRSLETGVTYHYRIVASNGSGTSRGADASFTTRGAPEVVTAAAAALGPDAATLGGTVDPNGRSTGWWIEYGTSTRYRQRTDTRSAGAGSAPVAVSTRVGGLEAGETYHFRLVASNDIGTVRGADKSFRTDPAPAVSTGGVDEVSINSARLSASVDPRGRGTVAWFEYGPTSGLGNRTPDVNVGFGTSTTRITANVGGLQAGTRYYFRALARSDAGTTAGQTRTFTTSAGPLVITGAAQLSGASVVLAGTVDPVGRSTTWWFEIGPTTSYGTSTVVRSAGSGRGAIAVSETVAGLTPGAEYHARLVARSSAGTTRGWDVVFRMGAAPVIGRATASGISLTRGQVGAEVVTSGLETRVWVELGRGGTFSTRTAAVVLPAAPSSARISIRVSGLAPGSRYSFRVVAANLVGTTTGPTSSFGTAARPVDERGRPVRCTIVGTNGPDRLVGTPRRDVICGLGGADVLVGRGANDILLGGPGADYLVPGTGRDRALGGIGNDFFVARDGATDLLFGGTGYDRARVDRRLDVTQSATRVL
jgi:phosphodiesterase/alkaline phosphatase D-like protein